MADLQIIEENQVLEVVEEVELVEVVEVAEQGLPGPAGQQGPEGGATLVPVGDAPLSGHSAVALGPDGALVAADCTVFAHLGGVVGVVADAYAPGESASVVKNAPLSHTGWTWTPGPVFVGIGGQLTQSLPMGAVFCQVVGHAVSATHILVGVQPAIANS